MKKLPTCDASEHESVGQVMAPASLERAAQLFRAMADSSRLRLLDFLKGREICVTEIATAMGEKVSTVSQRLRILRREGLVTRRRDGNHLYYGLADRHVADLILNALAHARELDAVPAISTQEGDD